MSRNDGEVRPGAAALRQIAEAGAHPIVDGVELVLPGRQSALQDGLGGCSKAVTSRAW